MLGGETTVQRTDALVPFEGTTTDRDRNDSMLMDIGQRTGSVMRVAEAPFLPSLGGKRPSLKEITGLLERGNHAPVASLADQWQSDAVKGQYGLLDPRRKTSQFKVSALDSRKRLPLLHDMLDELRVHEYMKMLGNSDRSLKARKMNGAAYMQVQYVKQNADALQQQMKHIKRDLAISSSRMKGKHQRGSLGLPGMGMLSSPVMSQVSGKYEPYKQPSTTERRSALGDPKYSTGESMLYLSPQYQQSPMASQPEDAKSGTEVRKGSSLIHGEASHGQQSPSRPE